MEYVVTSLSSPYIPSIVYNDGDVAAYIPASPLLCFHVHDCAMSDVSIAFPDLIESLPKKARLSSNMSPSLTLLIVDLGSDDCIFVKSRPRDLFDLRVSCQPIDIKLVVTVGSMSDVGGDLVLPSGFVDVLPLVDSLLPQAGNKFVHAPSVLDDMLVVLELLSNPVPTDRDVMSLFEQAP